MKAGGAIWNVTRSLAETLPRDRAREAALARIERNARERQLGVEEGSQLEWAPAPGRLPYAGFEDASERLE